MTTPPVSTDSFSIARIALEFSINAAPPRVWQALVEQTSQWWPRELYTGPSPKGFHIEPRLGGRMYEDWGDGAGLMWATVIGLDPPRSIDLLGWLTPAFGGPCMAMWKIALTAKGEKTTFSLSDTCFGRVTDATRDQLEEGWKSLYEGALKRFVENP